MFHRLYRLRTPIDYLYILRGEEPSYAAGPNTATVFIVLMQHNEFFEVEAKRYTDLDKEYAHVGERRMMRRRRDALDSKIEQTEVLDSLLCAIHQNNPSMFVDCREDT